jgi:hypothetical protein
LPQHLIPPIGLLGAGLKKEQVFPEAGPDGSARTRWAGDAKSETGRANGGELRAELLTSVGRCGRVLNATGWDDPTRWARWFVVLVLGVGLLALELVVFDDQVDSQLEALRAAGRSASNSAAITPSLPTPTIPAPLASGPITAVDLRAMGRCEPATACPSRLQVWVRPAPQPRRMDWVYQITDRCTGRSQLVLGGSMLVGAGGTQFTVVNGIQLPVGRALALNAVLEGPTRASSPTLLVPASATC